MDCACIKGYLDFVLIQLTLNKFVYVDASEWMDGERYKGEKEYLANFRLIETGQDFDVEIKGRLGQVVEYKDASFSGIYFISVVNCDTPYTRYGVSFFEIEEIVDRLIMYHRDQYREELQELQWMMDSLRIALNAYREVQDEEPLIERYNEIKDYANSIKCKL